MHSKKLGSAATSGNGAARTQETLADSTIQKDVRSTIDSFRTSSEKSRLKSTGAEQLPKEGMTITEELRAANEELTRVNERLQECNEEVARMNHALQERNADLNNVLHSVDMPILMVGKDLRIRQFTPVTKKVLHLTSTDIGRPISDIQPTILIPNLEALISEAIDTLSSKELEVHDGEGRWYSMRIRACENQENKIEGGIIVWVDITKRKQAEESLAEHAAELARSNVDLEQFAYVASHDLQEPLRMVTLYTQLLAKRYHGKLDAEADEFVGYAVDGAKRMVQLINDLLAYSRLSSRGKEFEPTDCEAVLKLALTNLQAAVQEGGAVVTHDPLPMVMADSVQLGQVFQNLIGNALKFHGEVSPRVHVSAKLKGKKWVFSVEDNGIGIEPQYTERIFAIFQRLHSRKDYSGTGIGLAFCKKIVESHGGRVWVESEAGQGATFYFTLPSQRRRKDRRRENQKAEPSAAMQEVLSLL